MTTDELNNRFDHHAPKDEDTVDRHEHIRACARGLAALIDQVCPDGREKAVAMTKLEEVMFWANASIARQ